MSEDLTPLSVVQTVASLDSRHGGVSRAVPQISDALFDQGCHVSVVYACETDLIHTLVLPERAGHRAAGAFSVARRQVWSPKFAAQIAAGFSDDMPRLLHDNGLWGYTNYAASRFARRHRIPLVISPHGMLEPWAVNNKRFRKRVALAVYQRKLLESATLLMVTAESEYRSVRQAGLAQPVAIVPLGVTLPGAQALHALDAPQRKILFLSRIHPKKGLLAFVEAWHRVRRPGWRIVIAGPDEAEHLAQVRALVSRLEMESQFEFLGEVNGAAKRELFESADVFALPTFSENFGVVVAEAMSYALPVLTTRGTPWSILPAIKAGWWVEPGVEGLTEGLRAVLATDAAERAAMGRAGRQFVTDNLTWSAAGRLAHEAYAWALGLRRDQPPHIRTD